MIETAHGNDQKILFTLTTGWISKENPWYAGNETDFYDQGRVESFLKRSKQDARQFDTLALPNPTRFDNNQYLKTVSGWVKQYKIDGIFVHSPYAVRKDLDRDSLEKIKAQFSTDKNFTTLSSNQYTPAGSRSPYSATFSNFVQDVFAPVSADFNADNFALSLNKNLSIKNGPLPLNPTWLNTPDYLTGEYGDGQNLVSDVAFAYLSPGVPVMKSTTLSNARTSQQIYLLNSKLQEALRARNNNLEFSAKFFVAQTDGVVAYKYASKNEDYVIVLNTTSKKLKNEKIEVPGSMTGTYFSLLSAESENVSESWSISLEPNSIKVFTRR